MNWGQAIVLTFILFAGFIGVMVFRMSRQRVDLVRDDYYQTEIAFQQHINQVANAHKNPAVGINYQADRQQVAFTLPASLNKGEILFYRPSDRQQDFNVQIPANHQRQQTVSTAPLKRGFWRVQLTWSDGQQDYYTEQDLFL
ncbi:FixH family protein [Spirosoma sp. SC4-14]|uniref:FixH family protein n=1 Tax=Spirosoma sp. SC4-14 TaxID=3128900 RepID=UPI0030D4A52C